MEGPGDDDTWVAITGEPLPLGAVADWAVRPDCGAVVVFSGTVRDHAEGRPGVTTLTYEAYAEQVEPRLAEIARGARQRWASLGRLALLHRTGVLTVGESSVLVAASAPHRAEAFEAARFCIDTLKVSVPIWKRETWEGGDDWGVDAHALQPVDEPARTRPVVTAAAAAEASVRLWTGPTAPLRGGAGHGAVNASRRVIAGE